MHQRRMDDITLDLMAVSRRFSSFGRRPGSFPPFRPLLELFDAKDGLTF